MLLLTFNPCLLKLTEPDYESFPLGGPYYTPFPYIGHLDKTKT